MAVAPLTLLVLNSGSSSLRATLFQGREGVRHWHFSGTTDHEGPLQSLLKDLEGQSPDGVVHRLVHGGAVMEAARVIDGVERSRLEDLVPLAPLHLPANLRGVDLCTAHFSVPQIACFDTAFHATLPALATRLPIPSRFHLRKFGFHGLSYAHLARRLPEVLGPRRAQGRIAGLHLGQGASACLMHHLTSVETTMGYSPAGGLVMGTRSGDLDPGVILALGLELTWDELTQVVYHEMGLWALSGGISADMKTLLADGREEARFAVEFFCRRIAQSVGSMATLLGGLDALVFTGGIGEHAGVVRSLIVQSLAFLGFALDESANRENAPLISTARSLPVLIIPADEEDLMREVATPLFRPWH